MRGESERVAERVRELLADHGRAPRDELEAGGPPAPGSQPPGFLTRLAARVPARVDPGRRVAIAVGGAVAVVAVLTGAWVLAARPSALPVSSSPPTASAAARAPVTAASNAGHPPGAARAGAVGSASTAAGSPAPSASALVVVDVAGKVRHPGLYRLPAGSRVDDAVRAAGGALPRVKLDGLNLAAKVGDGQQIAVGIPPATGGAVGGSAGGTTVGGSAAGDSPGRPSTAAPVDLNTAGLEQLEALPGVGPVLAQHILDWRSQHGSFGSVDQLQDVKGIGPAKFADLKPLVSV